MNRIRILAGCAALVLVATGWRLLASAPPVDTPYFQWKVGNDERYELVVRHVGGNPEFRRGVVTTAVPRSGTLRVLGVADPGAIVEVSNPRTGLGYTTTADASGAFTIEAEARRGDTLNVMSRRVQFRAVPAPGHSSAVASTPGGT